MGKNEGGGIVFEKDYQKKVTSDGPSRASGTEETSDGPSRASGTEVTSDGSYGVE